MQYSAIKLHRSMTKERSGILLQAGVCMRVPFNRVTITKSTENAEPNDMLDFAGVSFLSAYCDVSLSLLFMWWV